MLCNAGVSACFSISDRRILRAYDLMSQVMGEQLAERVKAISGSS